MARELAVDEGGVGEGIVGKGVIGEEGMGGKEGMMDGLGMWGPGMGGLVTGSRTKVEMSGRAEGTRTAS
jgi:hypothetical protein